MIYILSQRIKTNWQWILIPLLLVCEFALDQFILPVVYKLILQNVHMGYYNKYILLINIYKVISILVILLLNYLLLKQTIYLAPSKQKTGWLVFLIICLGLFLSSIHSKHFWIALDIGLIASLSEELLFRGLVLGKLMTILNRVKTSRLRVNLAVIIAAVIFGLYHYVNLSQQSFGVTTVQVVNAAGLGLVLGVIYVKSGSLWIPISLHFIYDFLVTIAKGFSISDYQALPHYAALASFMMFVIYAAAALTTLNVHYEKNTLLAKIH